MNLTIDGFIYSSTYFKLSTQYNNHVSNTTKWLTDGYYVIVKQRKHNLALHYCHSQWKFQNVPHK